MSLYELFNKIKNKARSVVVSYCQKKSFYPKIYFSYWHHRYHNANKGQDSHQNYLAAIPNRGAGIGHQLANWIAGYWYAKQFGLGFAHIPFSTSKWEDFFGFGENEMSVEGLVKTNGYKKVRLPLFKEFKKEEVELVKQIIDSYSDQKVVFIAEQDQYYKDQCGVIDDLQRKFFDAKSRQHDRLIYLKDHFNIAIHVRRGDIVMAQDGANQNLKMRWQDNSYFETVLRSVLQYLQADKPISIYLFSQGDRNSFKEFDKFPNIHFCLDMGVQESFLHMVFADLLITSKSSFSYKPALLNRGIKICPQNFWHKYPDTNDWVVADEKGEFNIDKFYSSFSNVHH